MEDDSDAGRIGFTVGIPESSTSTYGLQPNVTETFLLKKPSLIS